LEKKGVVRDKKVHEEVIDKVIGFAMETGVFCPESGVFPHQGTGGKY